MRNCFRLLVLSFLLFGLLGPDAFGQMGAVPVHIVGQMRDVMWKGELHGKISLDSLVGRPSLFGLGPEAFLRGEIMVMEGKVFRSRVVGSDGMEVAVDEPVEAPFFGYSFIPSWSEIKVPRKVKSLPSLEAFLLDRFGEDSAPFFFRLTGVVKEGVIHVVNLPEGTVVSSPEQAHQGLVQFSVADAPVSVLGFFSTKHQTIFTHHDTFIHAHLLTDDHRQMGHLDEVLFAKGSLRLWVPAQ